jgi:hypothetical protein
MSTSHSRTRSRGALAATHTDQEESLYFGCSNTSWAPTSYSYIAYGGDFEGESDVVIHGFKKRVAAGELFFNPRTYSRNQYGGAGIGYHLVSVSVPGCSSPLHYTEYRLNGNGILPFIPKEQIEGKLVPRAQTIVSQSTLRDLKSEVATEMLNKRGRSDSNLYESLAELDKTVGMFERPISRISRTLNRAAQAKREGKFLGYTVDGVSNLWLAYRYGIVPALNDIQGIVDGLKEKTEKRRATTRAKKGFEVSKTIGGTGVLSILTMTYQVKVTESYTVRAMSLDEFSTSLWENIGFTQKGLITVPWELVKYSFVADWFVNIGDFIGAIVPAFGYHNLGSAMTVIHGLYNQYQSVSTVCTNSGYTLLVQPSGSYTISRLEKFRGSVPFPDIVIKNDFRFDKWKRVADALSLLAQRGNRVFS